MHYKSMIFDDIIYDTVSLNKTIQNVIDDDYMIDFIMFFCCCLLTPIFKSSGNLSYETGRNSQALMPR